MNPAFPGSGATAVPADQVRSPYPDHMVAELLAMHEEMIVQLLLERLGVVGAADFLTSLIEQHEKAADMLRALLSNHEADPDHDGLSPRQDRPPPPASGSCNGSSAREPGINRMTAPG